MGRVEFVKNAALLTNLVLPGQATGFMACFVIDAVGRFDKCARQLLIKNIKKPKLLGFGFLVGIYRQMA
ncbi:hypothetical protein BTO09_06455 [Gilvibacter sp. SZ-19]|nr:hypothetical protein BTO09_06455 [Gilvibacter sp. SZ-19]